MWTETVDLFSKNIYIVKKTQEKFLLYLRHIVTT